jgi:hypothetical protein
MNDLNDRLRHERELPVPSHLTTEVERAVMQVISGKSPGWRARRRAFELAAASVLAVVLAVVVLRSGRELPPSPAPQFTESVILLDDHVCIWLEPVDDVSGKGAAQ